MKRRPRTSADLGFTLMELLVVVMILAVLTFQAVIQYSKTLESARGRSAGGIVAQIGRANSAHEMSHDKYTSGQLTNTCNSGSCSGSLTDACRLIRCQYLAADDWANFPYKFFALSPTPVHSATQCGISGVPTGGWAACAKRKICGTDSPPCTSEASYGAWGYLVDTTGKIYTYGGAPPP